MCKGLSVAVRILMLSIMQLAFVISSHAEEFDVTIIPDITDEQAASEAFVVEVLQEEKELSQEIRRVLIYHTHTFEAYEQTPDDPYVETEKWRSKDSEHNVIAVGNALASSLNALGVTVVHDTTIFEPPSLDRAYERSLRMLERRLADGETYDLIIDLHRDALSSQTTVRKTVNIGGESVARFMVLIGKGTTGGYAEKPKWEGNLVIAEAITDALNRQCDGLARNVKIKTGRFNQHISERCVLIECGMNMNTLDEVLAGIPYLAEAIRQVLDSDIKNPPAASDKSAVGG